MQIIRRKKATQKKLVGMLGALMCAIVLAGPASASASGEAETGAASDVSAEAAILHGVVNVHGEGAFAGFQYGTTTSYGKSTNAKTIKEGVYGPVMIEKEVTGLEPETIYHFRAVALTNGGLGYGADETFITTSNRSHLHPAAFEAQAYPASISGAQDVKNEVSFGGVDVRCTDASVMGSLGKASQSLGLTPEYGGCEMGSILEAHYELNSCQFGITLQNVGPPYAAHYGVQCEEEGDAIEVVAPGCLAQIPAQTFGGSLGAETEGEGEGREVHLGGTATGASYSITDEGLCGLVGLTEGSYEDGSLEVDADLSATYLG
ncbi:MAG TPA: hypothetical protein VG898_02255 [Solirubrobacterales bacterium]|nr:hypothetical protein [Solirubrobacterales bacterium]